MKQFQLFFCVILIVLLPKSLFGEENNSTKSSENNVYFGIGTNISPMNFYIPLQLGKNFRLEPQIGVSISNRSYNVDSTNLFYKYISNTFRFGLGGLYTYKPLNSLIIYSGIRFVLIDTYSENYSHNKHILERDGKIISIFYDTVSTVNKQISISMGAVLGAEYFIIKQFSVGLEAQLNFINYFTPVSKTNQIQDKYSNYNYYTFSNTCLIFVRYYFNY